MCEPSSVNHLVPVDLTDHTATQGGVSRCPVGGKREWTRLLLFPMQGNDGYDCEGMMHMEFEALLVGLNIVC